MRAYEYEHVVGFEETSLVGSVHYVNPVRWQGRCREMFLREHAPDLAQQLTDGLALATVRCTCEYLSELSAFDRVVVRMRLKAVVQNRITLAFEYWRRGEEGEELVGRGEQEIACMRRDQKRLVPAPLPESLSAALRAFAG